MFSVGEWLQPGPARKPGTKITPEVGSTLRQRADLLPSLVSQSLAAGCPFPLPCPGKDGHYLPDKVPSIWSNTIRIAAWGQVWSEQHSNSIPYWYDRQTCCGSEDTHTQDRAGPTHLREMEQSLGILNILQTSCLGDRLQRPPRLISCSLSSKYADLIHIKKWCFTYYYCNRYAWK